MEKVNIIGSRYFNDVEKFLRLNFRNFKIIDAVYTRGKKINADGIGHYDIKPSLIVIGTPRKRIYKFEFFLNCSMFGDYWSLVIDRQMVRGENTVKTSTSYFSDWNMERAKENSKEYKKILPKYIIKEYMEE